MTTSPVATESVNYPFNCWYVAATGDELNDAPLARELLGRPVLLYRKADGQAVAMTDICPHRAVALSLGSLEGDNVVCGYHGATFAPDGSCVRVPSQANVPYDFTVRTYPVREVGPIVWIWMGDPGRAAHREPPELPWLADDGWTVFTAQKRVAANYMALHENSLDFTHLPHVHGELSPEGYRETPPALAIEVSEYSVFYRRTFPDGPIPAWQAEATGLSRDSKAKIRESGAFLSPAVHIVHMDLLVPDPAEGERADYLRPWIRAFTPLNPAETLVFSWVARNYRLKERSVTETLRRIHGRLMAEDAHMIEEMYRHTLRYGAQAAIHLVNADIAAVKAQEIVHMMLLRERTVGHSVRRPFIGHPVV